MGDVEDSPAAKGPAHHVLMFLAYRADNETWICWPGYGHIAKRTGLSMKTVQRAVDKLVELGDIEIVSGGAGNRSNHYRIAPNLDGSSQSDHGQSDHGQSDYTPSQSDHGVSPQSPHGVVGATTKSVRNKSTRVRNREQRCAACGQAARSYINGPEGPICLECRQ